MQKRIVAIALCLVMVSAFAMTTASARDAGQSDVRQYDVKFLPAADGTPRVYGTYVLTINDDGTGTYVVNGNLAKVDEKEYAKTLDPKLNYYTLLMKVPGHMPIGMGAITLNYGGNFHGTGTLDALQVQVLELYGDDPDTTWMF